MSETRCDSSPPTILLVSLVFSPDGVSTASLLTDLAVQLHRMKHEVTVFTTTPHYNHDPEAVASQPLRPKWGRLLFLSDCQGIAVYHARVQAKGRRVMARVLDYLAFHLVGTLAGVVLGGHYQVVLAPSPPLTIGLSAMVLAAARRVPFVYNVQEIYPDIAVKLGVLRNRWLIRALEFLERFIYRRADAVVVISESFRQRLLAKGVPARKLVVIPNFVDVGFVQPGERRNPFSSRHALDNKFVVLYSGNIGLTQDIETILEAALLLRDWPEVFFLLVGDGARKDWLVRQLETYQIPNVRWLPYRPHSEVPQLYASSDLCVVPLLKGTAQDTFPSKIYTIMAAGRPAVVCADADSELAHVVEQAKCGVAVPPSDPAALAEGVRWAIANRERVAEMGRNGREYVVAHHSPASVAMQYHELLSSIVMGEPGAS